MLGHHGDARARDVLASAQISIDYDAREWEGTAGRIHGHRVTVGVDSAALATMDSVPAVRDAVCAAVAAAIAMHPGDAMADLHAFWAVQHRDPGAAYRGAVAHESSRDDPDALRAALEIYLRTAGEIVLATSIHRARFEVKAVRAGGHHVTVRMAMSEHRTVTADAHQTDALQRAIAAIMAGPEGSQTKVTLRAL